MHPWHWHRPSRLVWFVFGAISGAWAMKHKECADNYKVKHCSRYQIPQEAYPPPQGSAAGQDWHTRWKDRHPWGGWHNHESNNSAPAAETPEASRPVPQMPLPGTADGWDEERQRLLKIKQQAANSLLDFSEEGLDSLMTSMESLKARLAERRAQREQEALEQEAREADFKLFEEWKRERMVQAMRQEPEPQPKEPPKRLV